jgi:hypothetical protein
MILKMKEILLMDRCKTWREQRKGPRLQREGSVGQIIRDQTLG